MRRIPRLPFLLGAAACAVASLARPARADEIRFYDPATCEVKTEKGDVNDESWTQITWKSTPTSPIKKVETRLLVEIKRTGAGADDPSAQKLRAALDELGRGQYAAAREAFTGIAGGGLAKNPENDRVEFKPFPSSGDKKGKWYEGYAHFFWAKTAYLEGKEKNDLALLEAARRALDADSGGGEKGFLQRFREGKNRYYADAMALKGDVLLALGKPDDAGKAWDELYQKVIQLPSIGPRFAFEAKLGAGRIAEAKGDVPGAESAYEAAASALQAMLDAPSADSCARRELGRYWAEARVQKARVMLNNAEKLDSPPEYARLRKFLEEGSPESLKARLTGRPPEVVDAVVAGAQAPTVQAVVQNGIGLAYLNEKRYVDAMFAFNEVRIKHFAVRDEVARALWYLQRAASEAAKAATRPEAKNLFQGQAEAAKKELESSFKGWTPPARK